MNRKNLEEEIIDSIQDFFEKYNSKIQIFIFLISLIIGAIFNITQQNELGIIIGLLLLISGELISLSIKDSITQKKLNRLGTKIQILMGDLVRVHDFNLNNFFEKANKQFFISGMALNNFFEKNKTEIIEMLQKGIEIDVLIASPQSTEENVKLYHGINYDEVEFLGKHKDLLQKQICTLDYIKRIADISTYISNGKFILKTSDTVFSTSFVAYDIFDKGMFRPQKEKKIKGKEIKASFYQYGCTEPKNEPNIIVDSFYSRDWYFIFKKAIESQWKDANNIKGMDNFDALYQEIYNIITEISKKQELYKTNN